jgi:hypothetical protein
MAWVLVTFVYGRHLLVAGSAYVPAAHLTQVPLLRSKTIADVSVEGGHATHYFLVVS